MSGTVLVTGGTGYIGGEVIERLLAKGHSVHTTVRNLAKSEPRLRARWQRAGERLSVFQADLMSDEGWAEAFADCRYVLHVASPIPRQLPRHEDELIAPARDGTLRVLAAAKAAGVSRVVLTSSMAAVTNGHGHDDSYIYSEKDWSKINATLPPYPKSKTIAERAAWQYMESLAPEEAMELVAINPGMVYGPILEPDYGTSGEIVRKLMRRDLPRLPKLGWGSVDVRDVAGAHLQAMRVPAAAGQRFCCIAEPAWLADVAQILKKNFAGRGYKVPTRTMPNFAVRLAALIDKQVRLILYELGHLPQIDNSRIKSVLDWQPRGLEEMVTAMGESMIEHKVV